MIKSFNQFIQESSSFASTSSVNGMGPTSLPNNTTSGSGDIPFPLTPYTQFGLFLKELDKLAKKLKKKNPRK
jgi:hypothetical protein